MGLKRSRQLKKVNVNHSTGVAGTRGVQGFRGFRGFRCNMGRGRSCRIKGERDCTCSHDFSNSGGKENRGVLVCLN